MTNPLLAFFTLISTLLPPKTPEYYLEKTDEDYLLTMQRQGVIVGDVLRLREGDFVVRQIEYYAAPEDMFMAVVVCEDFGRGD